MIYSQHLTHLKSKYLRNPHLRDRCAEISGVSHAGKRQSDATVCDLLCACDPLTEETPDT